MKVDDWVQIQGSGEIGVVVALGALIVVRVSRKDNPFPKYITVPRREVKKLEHKYEEALL
jgi:hypothetical protein